MSKMIVGYWGCRGLGEPIRLMLEYVGEVYEDKRYGHCKAGDGWDLSAWFDVKFTLGFEYPNVPYLIDGDVKVSESWAVLKYIAMKHKHLAPANDEQQIKCNIAEGVVSDFRKTYRDLCYNADFEKLKGAYTEGLPAKLDLFEKNIVPSGWLAGPKITYVDFAFCETLDEMRLTFPGCFDKHPNLLDYLERFNALEKIASYKCSDRFHQFPVNGKMAAWIGEAE